jgi:hypothetical protein
MMLYLQAAAMLMTVKNGIVRRPKKFWQRGLV